MRTVKVTFSGRYVEGYDTLYTYETPSEEAFHPKSYAIVETPDQGFKVVQVIKVDEAYDKKAAQTYGPLKRVYTALELQEMIEFGDLSDAQRHNAELILARYNKHTESAQNRL